MSEKDPPEAPRTGPLGARDESGYSIRASHFWIGAAVLVVLVLGGTWLAIPGADTRHRLTAPSGNITLEVGEICGESSCGQIVVLDFLSPDGQRYRNSCETDLREDRPVFVTVSADWSEDETEVILNYADANGVGGSMTLDLAVDCAN